MEAAAVDPDSGEGGRGQPPRKWARASPVRACSSVALEDPSRGVCACTRTPPGQQQATTCPRRTKPTRPPPPLLPPAARARVSQPAAAAGPRSAGPWLDSAAAVPGKGRAGPRGARASCSARGAGAAPGRWSSTHRAAGLGTGGDLGAAGETGARASRGFPAALRGLPPGPVSWRAPGVVPLLGGQRVRVAAGHLFLLAPLRDYTRGGVRLRAAPAARQRINLVVGAW